MRVTPIAPDDLTDDQRPLDADMRAVVEARLQGFTSHDERGALVGPFAPLLAFPDLGGPAWAWTKALVGGATLPATVREVAILATGARFACGYELYAHTRVARGKGLEDAVVAALVAGQRPAALSEQEAVAHDVAAVLCRGGQLPDAAYTAATSAFGERGTAELVHLVANYAVVSMLLNAYGVPVPDDEV